MLTSEALGSGRKVYILTFIFEFNTMQPYVSQNRQIRSIRLSKFNSIINCVAFKPMYIDVKCASQYKRCVQTKGEDTGRHARKLT